MNEPKPSLDKKFVTLTMQAIREPEKWSHVLRYLIDVVGAKAAIITLRDRGNCQIINDDALVTKYHSPLIEGFSFEAITFYLTELRTIDPWAEAQIHHYPFHPTLMSRICPPEKLENTRFFDWLSGGGIEETIVFELERMSGYWSALNIFLGARDAPENVAVLEFAERHYTFVQEAWKSSQALLHTKQTEKAALDQLAALEIPACLTGSDGRLHAQNTEFDRLVLEGSVKVVGADKRLSVARSSQFSGDVTWQTKGVLRHDFDGAEMEVKAVGGDPDPLFEGKREQFWLVTFRVARDGRLRAGPVSFDLSGLAAQELALFKAIRNGKSIKDGGLSIGLQRSRTFEVWANVKEKLSISDAHELRALYPTSTEQN